VEGWLATAAARDTAGERLLGLISLVACRSAARSRHSIGWLVVHPEARRLGVGRALVAHACHRAAELAAETVWVETRSDWPAAIAFWRAVGFAPLAATSGTRDTAPGAESPDMLA
jgi:ribosomal protein S18 acetylase RimI-like enzyme